MRTKENHKLCQQYNDKTGAWGPPNLLSRSSLHQLPSGAPRTPHPTEEQYQQMRTKESDTLYQQYNDKTGAWGPPNLLSRSSPHQLPSGAPRTPHPTELRCRGSGACVAGTFSAHTANNPSWCLAPHVTGVMGHLETPRVLQPNPDARECDYCGKTPIKGACHMCNRPLCDTCSMNQMPPACWVCPSKGALQKTHLGVPEAPRHVGSSYHRLVTQDPWQVAQEADRLTQEAGRGRLMNGSWVLGRRKFAHRACPHCRRVVAAVQTLCW